MTLTQSILLGTLQGLTEFLPVSSSGHLALAQHFMTGFEQPGILFDVLLHLGTMVAVVIYFRQEVLGLLSSPFRRGPEAVADRRMLWLVVLGSIPTAVIGLLFKDTVEQLFTRPVFVAAMLLVTGLILFVAERYRCSAKNQSITAVDALLTGVAQGCAVLPGISRSGSTISALLLRGVDGQSAARFSFLLALPAVCGAALLSLKDVGEVAVGEIHVYLIGAAVACLVGMLGIHALLAVLRRQRLYLFTVYCWLVGSLALLGLLGSGM